MGTEIFLFLIGFIAGGVLIWFVRQKELDVTTHNNDSLKAVFGDLSKQALDANLESFLKLAETRFNDLLRSSDEKLGKKKELIDSTLKDMKSDLKDLSDNTVALRSQMEESRKSVGRLSDTTSQLRQILSSSQARGQWGERMVEDILNFIGLSEGINYNKQTQSGSDRPDFTFFLPEEKSINMDVKFPLVHYEKYLASESESEKESEKKAFLKDVRERVKEVAKRSYVNPEGGTVDYVLLFIPNESIYAFLNQEDHGLIDFSLERKIMLCSPITLYAILSLVRQAVSNFAMEQKAGEMQLQVGVFSKQWVKYLEKLESLGKTLGTLTTHYEDLKGTRLRALERPMEKISELQLGHRSAVDELEE